MGFTVRHTLHAQPSGLTATSQDTGEPQDHRSGVEQWLAVGGGWWRLVAVGGGWRRLAGGGRRSLGAFGFLRTALNVPVAVSPAHTLRTTRGGWGRTTAIGIHRDPPHTHTPTRTPTHLGHHRQCRTEHPAFPQFPDFPDFRSITAWAQSARLPVAGRPFCARCTPPCPAL